MAAASGCNNGCLQGGAGSDSTEETPYYRDFFAETPAGKPKAATTGKQHKNVPAKGPKRYTSTV